MYKSNIIDNTTHKFLTSDSHARTPHLYLLPKIHKQDIPGRPIISGCGGPTVKLSQYADHLLKPLLNHIPSYIQDTTYFLRRILTLNTNLPKNIILVTIDVRSLYTNIPNDQGIQACIDMLKENNMITPESEQSIIDITPTYATHMAPTCANIFMAMLERKLLQKAPNNLIPIEWIRFIHDIFAIRTHGIEKLQQFLTYIRTHGIEKLQQFLTYMNEFHPTIKFNYTYSHESVNFLDTTIYINPNDKLESDLHIKPTDRTLMLHHNSFHPQSCKNAIVYSQTLRYRRIITDNDKLHNRLNHLLVALIHRGYTHDNIMNTFNKALKYTTQNELLNNEKTPKTNNSPIFSIQYNKTKYIPHILRKHWSKHILRKHVILH